MIFRFYPDSWVMKKDPVIWCCSLIFLVLQGVANAEEFRFKGGDVDEGKIAFERLNCIQCHRVTGVELEDPKTERVLNLSLAGEIRFVKSYTDILLAITNPQHVVTTQYSGLLSKAELDGEIEPFMPDLSQDMSAAQLIDLAAFLDSVYSKNLAEYRAMVKR